MKLNEVDTHQLLAELDLVPPELPKPVVNQAQTDRERLPIDLHMELEKLRAHPITERTLVLAELVGFPARALYEYWKRREE